VHRWRNLTAYAPKQSWACCTRTSSMMTACLVRLVGNYCAEWITYQSILLRGRILIEAGESTLPTVLKSFYIRRATAHSTSFYASSVFGFLEARRSEIRFGGMQRSIGQELDRGALPFTLGLMLTLVIATVSFERPINSLKHHWPYQSVAEKKITLEGAS
jgi:hypothetical protein